MTQIQMVIPDTNIIIELYKENVEVRAVCDELGEENLFITSVEWHRSFIEVLGIRKNSYYYKKHIRKFPLLHINEGISEVALNLMERYCLSHHPFIGGAIQIDAML